MNKLFYLCIFLLFLTTNAFAIPSITNVNGSVDHNQTVTISGSGFGSKTTAAPVVWDNCSGTSITSKWTGGWPDASGAPYDIAYRTPVNGISLPHSNITKYLAGVHYPGTGAYSGYNVMVWKSRTVTFPAYTYASWYQRTASNWTFGSDNNFKVFDYSEGSNPYKMPPNWYIEYNPRFTSSSSSGSWHIVDDNSAFLKSSNEWWFSGAVNPSTAWSKIEVELKYTNQSDGYIKLWENGVLKINYTDRTDSFVGTTRAEGIGGFARPYGYTNNWRYFADLYLDYSRARVILGNNSSYSNCTIREVQIPSSWSTTSITFTVNEGKFTNGQTAYLYVVDSDGVVNEIGRPVTIGTGVATPVISNVTGTISHNNSVVISGIGFGSKSHPGPLVWDDFEGGSVGTSVVGKSAAFGGKTWSLYTGASEFAAINYDSSGYRGKGAKKTSDGNNFYALYMTNFNNQKLYSTVKTKYLPSGSDGIYKPIRMNSGTAYTGNPKLLAQWQPSGWFYTTQDTGTSYEQTNIPGGFASNNAWHRLESYLSLSDPGGSSNGAYFIGSELGKVSKSGVVTRGSGITGNLNHIFTPMEVANASGTWTFYIDDVYIDDTQARVELGDSPTWSTCVKKEIQRATSWSSSSITINLNAGTFSNGQTAYLYVIDGNGTVNATGRSVTIGSTSGVSAPTVSNATSSAVDGATVSVSGSGFGTSPLASPAKVEFLGGKNGPIESGTDNVTFSRTNWTNLINTTWPRYDNAIKYSGNNSLLFDSSVVGNGDFGLSYDPGSESVESYTSWWSYISTTVAIGEWRPLRINYNRSSTITFPEFSFSNWFDSTDNVTVRYNSTNQYDQVWEANNLPNINEWVRFELYTRASSGTNLADGFYELYVHRAGQVPQLVSSASNIKTYGDANRWRYYIFENYLGGDLSNTSKVWNDDIYIGHNSQARVELGNASIWNNCTQREIQKPLTWTSTGITFELNQGRFTTGQTVYIYIVDSNGVVNSTGKSITLAQASPGAGNVSGTASEDSILTINGSGFGSGPIVQVFDDFESGTVGQVIKTGTGSADYGTWTSLGAHQPIYSNASAVSGTKAARADMAENAGGNYIAKVFSTPSTDVFVSWWLYLPAGDNFPGENASGINWKQMWLMGDNSTVDDDLVIPTYMPDWWYVNGNDAVYKKTVSVGFTKGSWKRLWCYVKGNSTATGKFRFFELTSSGVATRADDSNVVVLDPGGIFERVHVNGYGRTATNSHPMFDDVYIATGVNAQARVEIGNNSNYTNCTKLSILVPTSWSDSRITAKMQVGNFVVGQTAYLFVINSNGNVVNANGLGYPIVIGSAGIPPDLPPEEPPPVVDTTPPVVSAFDIPASNEGSTIPIDSFEATDEIGVAGYLVTEGELSTEKILNGIFDTDYTNWTAYAATLSVTSVGGRSNVLKVADSGIWSAAHQTITTEPGAYYLITYDSYPETTTIANGIAMMFNGAFQTAWGFPYDDVTAYVSQGTLNQWNTHSFIFKATGTTATLALHSDSDFSAYFDDVSIKKISNVPLVGDVRWNEVKPTFYQTLAIGDITLFAWAKDTSGNISAPIYDTVTITQTTPPVEVNPNIRGVIRGTIKIGL